MTNNSSIVCQVMVLDTVVSDHRLILVGTYIDNVSMPHHDYPESRDFAKLNFNSNLIEWQKLDYDLLNVDWASELNGKYPSEMLKIISEILLSNCSKYIPLKGERRNKSAIPKDRKILMRKRAKMNHQIKTANRNRVGKLVKKLNTIEYKLLESHNKEEKERELRAIRMIKSNSKYFFSYAKSKSSFSVPIGPLEVDGDFVSDPKLISHILQKQYQSAFSLPKYHETNLEELEDESTSFFCNITICEEEMERAICRMAMGAAPGPDGIPPVLLKECKNSLKLPLCLLWRNSMESGVIPDILKLGLIVPVYKSGARYDAKNYRPITLTSHLIKVFERVVAEKLVGFMEVNDLFNQRQHGFRRNRSCLSQLMDHCQNVLNIMETGSDAEVIYLDFAKAFDKVDHGILIRKMVKMGIGGPILRWIQAFLTNRKQVVKVQDNISSSADVVSGVPQGTVLGPILFLIFVGDIDEGLLHAHASSFADDTRIVLKVKTHNDGSRSPN